ncbi:MAG: hypothetical protein KJ653_09720, partial [Candidatus Thermoplasmatota archaeon]|nr:hypothetical protein [Candidatus Thermoplasmatota archaeon]
MKKAALACWFRVRYTQSFTEEKDTWRRPRKVRSICLDKIEPLVESLRDLRAGGVEVTMPWEFFREENPPEFKGILRSPDLRGPLRLLIYQNKEAEWIRPSLLEWDAYLEHVRKELEPFYDAYAQAVFESVESGGMTKELKDFY